MFGRNKIKKRIECVISRICAHILYLGFVKCVIDAVMWLYFCVSKSYAEVDSKKCNQFGKESKIA